MCKPATGKILTSDAVRGSIMSKRQCIEKQGCHCSAVCNLQEKLLTATQRNARYKSTSCSSSAGLQHDPSNVMSPRGSENHSRSSDNTLYRANDNNLL
jgi:hypothetical protein